MLGLIALVAVAIGICAGYVAQLPRIYYENADEQHELAQGKAIAAAVAVTVIIIVIILIPYEYFTVYAVLVLPVVSVIAYHGIMYIRIDEKVKTIPEPEPPPIVPVEVKPAPPDIDARIDEILSRNRK